MNLSCITFETQNINLAPIIATAIAAIIVIIGWFIIAYLNRRNEKAKELRKYRLNLLLDLDKLRTYIITKENDTNKYNDLLTNVHIGFKTFSNKDEWNEYIKLHTALDEQNDNILTLMVICREVLSQNIRKELNLEKSIKKHANNLSGI